MTRYKQIKKYWESESEKVFGQCGVNILVRKGILNGVKSYKFNKENWLAMAKGNSFLLLKMGLVQVNLDLIDLFD